LVAAEHCSAFFKNVGADFSLRFIIRKLKLAATVTVTILLLGTVPIIAAPVELDYMEYNSDANARAAYVSNSSITATGGTITEVDGYRIHTFTSNGTFTIDIATNVEVLVVAGGGGGGSFGGGGGAGGLIYISTYLATGNITVIVGSGGNGDGNVGGTGDNGQNSVFGTLTVIGGGGGGSRNPDPHTGVAGATGGSGGGGSQANTGSAPGGSGTAGQGNAGGSGKIGTTGIPNHAGGGGGGSGVGGGNWRSGIGGGLGGDGLQYSISGNAVFYAGGGGGCVHTDGTPGTGGAGGGGNGGWTTGPPTNGEAGTFNTGGGGGGSGYLCTGGAGGSGIVIVRYPIPFLADSEDSIKTQGSYALKSTAPVTTSLNKTLTRTVSPTIDLSNKGPVKFDMRASRTGSNIKIGIHDSGGTTTEITPNITSADNYQTVTWDISGVSNANKDVIDQIIITIVNADAANVFYIDNFFARNYPNNPSALGQQRSDDDEPIAFGIWTNNLTPKATFYLSDDDAGDDVKYRIQVSTKSDFTVNLISHTSVELSQGTTNYIMTGLSSGSSYYWRVMTIDTYTYTSGWSTANADDIAVKIDTQPPAGYSVSSVEAYISSCTVNWNTATDSASGLHLTPYKIRYSTDSGFTSAATTATVWMVELSTKTLSLTPNTTYYFQVKAKDAVENESGWSATATKVTLCKVPVGMTIASPSYTQLDLNWDANGNPDGTKYIAHCSPDGFATIYSSTVTATTATFSSLTRNTEYEVRVYAVNHDDICIGYLGPYSRKTQPCVWQEKTTTRTGPNAFGFEGDGVWTWKVPANGGSLLTITAYAQYNSAYGGATKPKFTLSNMGVNSSDQMTGGADTWEKLTVSGTPSGKGVLFLKVEGFSTAVDAKYFVDDIQVSQ